MIRIQRFQLLAGKTASELFRFKNLLQFPELDHGISTRHTESKQKSDVQPAQPHGNKVAWVKRPGLVPRVDAVLTAQPALRLRVGTSDCVPIIVYEPQRRRGGVIHAGLKGTTQDILSNVLRHLKPKQVWLGIGPAIGAECYHTIHLQEENILQALAAGVPAQQIEVMSWCTKCQSDTFFSYRSGDQQNFGTYFELVKT